MPKQYASGAKTAPTARHLQNAIEVIQLNESIHLIPVTLLRWGGSGFCYGVDRYAYCRGDVCRGDVYQGDV